MWKPFTDSESLYMIRLEQEESGINLLLTNFLLLWETQISLERLVKNFKENNSLIEATDSQVLSSLLEIVENLQNVKITVNSSENDVMTLRIEKSCKDLSHYVKSEAIVYQFSLEQKSLDEFKNKVTISAIQTIYYLEKQQKMLLNLVQKKDRELEEYRMEKGEISRTDLKTEKFKPEGINTKNDKLFLNVFTNKDSQEFWKKFSEDNGEIEINNLNVETEPWNASKRRKIVLSSKNVVKRGAGITYKK